MICTYIFHLGSLDAQSLRKGHGDGFRGLYLRLLLLLGQLGFDALLSFEVEFHPVTLVFCVDEAECVATKTMHMTVRSWDTAVTHYDSHLVECFW